MYTTDRITDDLNIIKAVAETKEDGNTVALVERMLRDLGSLHFHYTTIEIPVPAKKAKAESKGIPESNDPGTPGITKPKATT